MPLIMGNFAVFAVFGASRWQGWQWEFFAMKLFGPTFPHFRLRVLSWVGDLALGTLLLSYFRSFARVEEFENDLRGLFLGFGESWAAWMASALLIYFFALCLRFYSTLFFGLSPGQKILGFKYHGHFFWKRVAGAVRVLLASILGPLLIDGLPLFRGKKTVSEFLTMTTLLSYPSRWTVLRSYLLLPILLLLCLLAPLLEDLTLIDGVNRSFVQGKKEKLKGARNFASFNHYFSNQFSFSSFSSLQQGRFLLIPFFKIQQGKNKKEILPSLIFYDLASRTYGGLEKVGALDLRSALVEFKAESFFFGHHYPALDKVLKEDAKEYAVRKYDKSFRHQKILSVAEEGELNRLVMDSLSLNLSQVFPHIAKSGPFLSAYIHFRKKFMASLKNPNLLQGDIIAMGNYHFLRFQKKAKGQAELLIPLGTLNAQVYEFFWQHSEKNPRADFRQTFFNVVDWYFDYKNVFAYPSGKNEMGPLQIIDFYTAGGPTLSKRGPFEDYIYHYMFDLCKVALLEEDEKLQKLLLDALSGLSKVGHILNQDLKKMNLSNELFSQRFLKFIAGLKISLGDKDNEFFLD